MFALTSLSAKSLLFWNILCRFLHYTAVLLHLQRLYAVLCYPFAFRNETSYFAFPFL